MKQNQNTNTTNKVINLFFYRLVVNTISLAGFVFLLAVVCVLLIGVYHTLIYLTTKASASAFLTVIPAVTLILSVGVILFKQPVHNLLCLITVFFSTVMLYLYVGAEFLAFLFLIVYVGAIAILFLFVIMLLHIKELTGVSSLKQAMSTPALFVSAAVTAVGLDDGISYGLSHFLAESDILAFNTEANRVEELVWFVNNSFSDILMFSDLLYTYHSYLFYIAAMLLLTAMLGAIILATSATDDEK